MQIKPITRQNHVSCYFRSIDYFFTVTSLHIYIIGIFKKVLRKKMKEYTHSSLICMTSGFMKSQQLAATRADTAQAKVLSKHMSDTIRGITQGEKYQRE